MSGGAVAARCARPSSASCILIGRHTRKGTRGPGEVPNRILTERQQRMFTHVMVGANDLAASKKFYDAVLGAIGLPAGQADPKGRIFYRTKTGVFGITKPIDGQPATHANGGTIGFACASPEQARAFHDAGVANGGKSIEDPPGWREGAAGKLYLAYLRDPSGNKICALHRG